MTMCSFRFRESEEDGYLKKSGQRGKGVLKEMLRMDSNFRLAKDAVRTIIVLSNAAGGLTIYGLMYGGVNKEKKKGVQGGETSVRSRISPKKRGVYPEPLMWRKRQGRTKKTIGWPVRSVFNAGKGKARKGK